MADREIGEGNKEGGLGAGEIAMGKLEPLKLAAMPTFLGIFAYLGPGILWAALAQGSGELIWWPYLTAKYGAAFLGLLIPASLLQYWVNLEIMRYVILTGETPMTGFTRIGKWYSILIFIGIFIENMWFGAYASAGGTALGTLTQFPAGWSAAGRALFWGYLSIGIYLIALTFGRVVYTVVEKFSMLIVLITMTGVVAALVQPKVYSATGQFIPALLPHFSWPGNWDPKDLGILVTSIAYAGAGGFGQLFIGYWIRDKGAGMGKLIGRVTSPITGEPEAIPATGYAFADSQDNRKNYRGWVRYIAAENLVGIFLNTLTTAIMCWLAWALLTPEHKVPKGWEIAVVQSAFFEVAWGKVGKALFLVVAAAFLCDAWLQLTDGFSRVWADFVYSNLKPARRYHFRTWYYLFVALFSVTTIFTMALAQPGKLIMIRGICSFLAMSVFCPGLIYLNYYLIPRAFPRWVQPHPINKLLMYLCTASYVGMSIAYLYLVLGGRM